jgi:hypothetical protein
MILVVSSPSDPHASAVRTELSRTGSESWLLDLRAFPTRLGLSLHYANDYPGPREVRCWDGCDLDLREVRTVWWRRPQPFELGDGLIRPSHRAFAYNECYEAWSGLWQTLDAFWVNHPLKDEAAARKAFQLDVARSVGLTIPRTLITNEPAEIRRFIAEHRAAGVIYKAFSATEQEWRETRLLGDAEEGLLEQVRHAPVIFQEYIHGVDLRVTVVGDALFAAAIHAQDTSYHFDFRIDMNAARVEPFVLRDSVHDGLMRLMRCLGLQYGAIDMRQTADGNVVFLEINPAGQWLFIEDRTGQPITRSMAELLRRGDSSRG